MQLFRNGSRPSQPGPAQWFTGFVRIDPLYTAEAPSRVGAVRSPSSPGARTAWHSHPLGQTLVVTSGVGWTQVRRRARSSKFAQAMSCGARPGTSIGTGHRDEGMTHIAIQEALNGKNVTWMEKVSDEDYLAEPATD